MKIVFGQDQASQKQQRKYREIASEIKSRVLNEAGVVGTFDGGPQDELAQTPGEVQMTESFGSKTHLVYDTTDVGWTVVVDEKEPWYKFAKPPEPRKFLNLVPQDIQTFKRVHHREFSKAMWSDRYLEKSAYESVSAEPLPGGGYTFSRFVITSDVGSSGTVETDASGNLVSLDWHDPETYRGLADTKFETYDGMRHKPLPPDVYRFGGKDGNG